MLGGKFASLVESCPLPVCPKFWGFATLTKINTVMRICRTKFGIVMLILDIIANYFAKILTLHKVSLRFHLTSDLPLYIRTRAYLNYLVKGNAFACVAII